MKSKKQRRCEECGSEFRVGKSPMFCDKCYDRLCNEVRSNADIHMQSSSVEDDLIGRKFEY